MIPVIIYMPCQIPVHLRSMTLEETMPAKEKERSIRFNKLFTDVLTKAMEENRVTTGIFNCAKQLQMYPDRVLFCVMPVNIEGDDSTDIQHVLLKAYCREQYIKIIYVDSSDKLNDLVQQCKRKDKTADCSCLLIEGRKDGASNLDSKFCHMYKELVRLVPCPVVQIPQ